MMQAKYEIKSEFLGPEEGQNRELRVLNRVLRWTSRGIEYEPDQRHSEIIVKTLKLEHAKAVNTPVVAEEKDALQARENSKPLKGAEATEYRALAARLNYLALDRMDLQYAAKCISKYMSKPVEYDMTALKRVGRYLVGKPRFTQIMIWQSPPKQLSAYSDSDWAGDKCSRKSTSGGLVMAGAHLIKSWSSTQQVIALSSGEAEVHALTKAAAQTRGIMSTYLDFSIRMDCVVHTDANAAMGIVHRIGLGRTRHIDVQYLWIQQKVGNKELTVAKVSTHDNPADVLTKALTNEVMEKHLKNTDCKATAGRAETAPQLNNLGEEYGVNVGDHRNGDSWISGPAAGWIRVHRRDRQTLFTPMKVYMGPEHHADVGELRVTNGIFADGSVFEVRDEWKRVQRPHRKLRMPWTGTTTFE